MLIEIGKAEKGLGYGLMPFVVGIYEEQVDRMDADFAALMEEYFKVTGYSDLFDTEPEIFKIVPVNKVIPVETSIFPYQQAEEIVKKAKSWGYNNLIWFRGGWKEWSEKRLPAVTE